jgi:hypothetical protein
VADPNWLLSSAAQSAAALVAIVGGFLVSRVIGISAERDAASTRLYDLTGRLEQVKVRQVDVVNQLRDHDFEDWFEEVEGPVMESKGAATPEALFDFHAPDPWTVDDFAPALRNRLAEYRQAFERLGPEVRRREDFSAICTRLGLDAHNRASRIWEYVHFSLQTDLGPDFEEPYGLHLPIIPADSTARNAALEGQRAARRNDLVNQRSETSYQVRDLESQIDQTSRFLGSFIVPPDVWRGFRVLVYFSIVGIVWPLSLMALQVDKVSAVIRGATVTLFVSGLGALAIYLGGLIRRAERKPQRQSSP